MRLEEKVMADKLRQKGWAFVWHNYTTGWSLWQRGRGVVAVHESGVVVTA